MARRTAVGIIGCGNVSQTYLKFAPLFVGLEIVAIADIDTAAAKTRSEQFSVRAMSVDELLKEDEIEVVINLTVPDAHYAVSQAILSAGKHAYSEKPLALTYEKAKALTAEAEERGLVIGGAPDTFLGAGAQTARQLIDTNAIGGVIAGTAHVMSHGMEDWHPNPTFFYQPGGGPGFDVGPYYITTLVSLLGPVTSVAAMAKKGFAERLVTAEGPVRGKRIEVRTPTTLNAVLEFLSGAQVTMGASWDVWKHGHANPIELYGTSGSMYMPDPNFFGGIVWHTANGGDPIEVDTAAAPFGAPNWPETGRHLANYRMIGVADMVDAIRSGREPRCSGRLAAHVVDVMESIEKSAASRQFVEPTSSVERPAPLAANDARRLTV